MQSSGISFHVTYEGTSVLVEVYTLDKQTLYRVNFPEGSPFFAMYAKSTHGDFWTSVPQGNQALAETFGPLIDDYIHQFGKPDKTNSPKRKKPESPQAPTLF